MTMGASIPSRLPIVSGTVWVPRQRSQTASGIRHLLRQERLGQHEVDIQIDVDDGPLDDKGACGAREDFALLEHTLASERVADPVADHEVVGQLLSIPYRLALGPVEAHPVALTQL